MNHAEVACKAVMEVLGSTALPSPADNFLDLGGDSLSAIELAILLQERTGIAVSVSQVIAAQDIAEIMTEAAQANDG